MPVRLLISDCQSDFVSLGSSAVALRVVLSGEGHHFRVAVEDGLRSLTSPHKGVREQYGPRSEELVELGLQPFRSRTPTLRAGEAFHPGRGRLPAVRVAS